MIENHFDFPSLEVFLLKNDFEQQKEEQICCAQKKNVDQIEKRWRWKEVIVLDDDSMQLLIKVLFSRTSNNAARGEEFFESNISSIRPVLRRSLDKRIWWSENK